MLKKTEKVGCLVFLVIALLLMLGESLNAADPCMLRGFVVDRETTQSLDYVYIRDSSGKIIAITDVKGRYTIKFPNGNNILLIFSRIGYLTDSLFIDGITSELVLDTLFMQAAPAVVEGITVSALPNTFRAMTPQGFESFKGEELYYSPGGFSDPLRYLQILPSVAITNDYRNDLVVRGGNPAECVIIVDGFEVSNINHFGSHGSTGGPFGMILSDYVAETNFSPGGFSVKYPNRMSSVLEIQLKSPSDPGSGGTIRTDLTGIGASYNRRNNNGSFNLLATARKSYLDFLESRLELPSVPVYADFTFKSSLLLPPNQVISLFGLYGFDRFSLPPGKIPFYDGQFENDQDQTLVGIKLVSPLSDKSIAVTRYSFNYLCYDVIYNMRSSGNEYKNQSIERRHRFNFDFNTFPGSNIEFACGINHCFSNNNYRLNIFNYIDEYGK